MRSAFRLSLLAGVCLLGAPPRALAQGSATGTLKATANIDGISDLHFSPAGIFWQHRAWAAPGLHVGLPEPLPTQVALRGPAKISLDWCPVWENGCDTCAGTCGELRDEHIQSRPLELPLFPGPLLRLDFECQGRERCELVQVPGPQNGFTGIIEFNDAISPGFADYTAVIRYKYRVCRKGHGARCTCPPDGGVADAGQDSASGAADAGRVDGPSRLDASSEGTGRAGAGDPSDVNVVGPGLPGQPSFGCAISGAPATPVQGALAALILLPLLARRYGGRSRNP